MLVENPPWPPFFKGGNAYTPVLLVIAIGALIPPQAFLSSPFDKGGQGGFYNTDNRNKFLAFAISQLSSLLGFDDEP